MENKSTKMEKKKKTASKPKAAPKDASREILIGKKFYRLDFLAKHAKRHPRTILLHKAKLEKEEKPLRLLLSQEYWDSQRWSSRSATIDGKKYTAKELAGIMGRTEDTARYRIDNLPKNEDTHKLLDDAYWQARRGNKRKTSRLKRYHDKEGNLLTAQQMADTAGVAKDTIKERMMICRSKKWPSWMALENIWRAGDIGGEARKQYNERQREKRLAQRETDRKIFSKIPGPSSVEKRMEVMGIL